MVKKSENIIVGVSIGDLNGIGPEVILKTFEDSKLAKLDESSDNFNKVTNEYFFRIIR